MAEIDTGGGGGKKKGDKVRSKKMSTKIDFTPMVDLGFLLITFFMLTTTLNKPNIMSVVMPDDKDLKKDDQKPVKEGRVLTLMLGGNDKVYYYNGITNPTLDSTDFSAEGLRTVILNKIKEVDSNPTYDKLEYEVKNKETGEMEKKTATGTVVLIKPTKESKYKNLVDALDEMAITKIRSFVIMDISEAEEKFIKNPAGGMNVNVTDLGK
jgi:biopolymer transport protein ExbD